MDTVAVRIEGEGNSESEWSRSAWLGALPVRDADTLLQGAHGVVVVSPHPDDEVLACAGLMQAACARGIPLRVVSVTDGEACYPGQSLWPAERLRSARRRELADAMRTLGLDATQVIPLGLPDGGVTECEAELVSHLAAMLAPGDLVVAPWTGDAHPDHEAAGRAANAAALVQSLRVLQYPVWAWHWLDPQSATAPWPSAWRLPLCMASQARKHRAMQAFSTQTGDIDGLGCDPILPEQVMARFRRPYEVLIG
ncbi:PIG-L family deacetylase [Stenotrophomonas tumulicola]|uniref:PIG-L family deacetylase n=1 Tax=Stenotrophomonas tumulicola TaxID=1685415 RepID=A0A7W3FK26_9GAMM|nr:PIG-L family deacetylase [Stenotrophomonas tumulicola]